MPRSVRPSHAASRASIVPSFSLVGYALGALVEGLAGQLGEYERQLIEGLAQLRMAFVQIRAAQAGDAPEATATPWPGPDTA